MSRHANEAFVSAYRRQASQLIAEAGQARFTEAQRSLFDVARWYAALAAHVERRQACAPAPAMSKGIVVARPTGA